MINWMKEHKVISFLIVSLLLVFILIVMPLVINAVYYMEAPCSFLKVGYDISSILNFYGAVLTFIGTVSLGIITVFQNYLSQKKSDEVNRLTLELQKKSMVLAEQKYEKEKQFEKNKNIPKFEIHNVSSNGNYMNLQVTMKNVSNNIVSSIKPISFTVIDDKNSILISSDNIKIDKFSLMQGDEAHIRFNNAMLKEQNVVNGQQTSVSYKNITINWSFQCDDSYGDTNYFKAKLYIEDSNRFNADLWLVEKVG